MADDGLLSSYQFDLPVGAVAQFPAERRDASRLMELAADGSVRDCTFAMLPELLAPGDLLVRNNVRVLPARLIGRRRGGGTAELLLVRRREDEDREVWLCMARPANRFKPGREFSFGDGALVAVAGERDDQGMIWVTFSSRGRDFMRDLERYGRVPLPPYIERPDKRPTSEDAERYQTVYASRPGAVAAPTAGLHFTPGLDAALAARGVGLAEVTLNVGPGTFRPIQEEELDRHRMHSEWYEVPTDVWERLRAVRERGGRVVAVGTTTVRALESVAAGGGMSGWTDIFIRPGYEFKTIDGMVTNFHLPGSSLLVMISALAGRERVMAAYKRAIESGYRFYSYGDAMLIWKPGSAS